MSGDYNGLTLSDKDALEIAITIKDKIGEDALMEIYPANNLEESISLLANDIQGYSKDGNAINHTMIDTFNAVAKKISENDGLSPDVGRDRATEWLIAITLDATRPLFPSTRQGEINEFIRDRVELLEAVSRSNEKDNNLNADKVVAKNDIFKDYDNLQQLTPSSVPEKNKDTASRTPF